VFLTVTPQANLITDEVTMALVPKVIIARTGGTFENITYKDPEERASQSIVRVPSGNTIIIGGLLRKDTSKTLTKVPILGDIPFVGKAFRHIDDSVVDRELIIFITPHILPDSTAMGSETVKRSPLSREQDVPGKKMDAVNRQLGQMEQ